MTVLRNGRGITSVQYRQDRLLPGVPLGEGFDLPYENPLLPQISTLTLAATADATAEVVAGQVWTITLTDPDSVAYVTTYTVTAADETFATGGASEPEVLEYMAGVLAGSIEANPAIANIVGATASGSVITVTWVHPDQGVWTITAVCSPAAVEDVLVATPAASQAAGGAPVPMGRFVAMTPSQDPNGVRAARLPTSAADVLAGVTIRDISQSRPFNTSLTAVDSYPAGSMMAVRELGHIGFINVGPTAAVLGDPVHTVIDVAGGQELGQARPTRDGVAQVITATPTVANDTIYRLQVDLPEYDGLPALTRTFEILSDASATDAEIVAAFQGEMAADAAFTAQVVASGTTTLVLTGQVPGRPFTVLDVQEGAGDWASITTTTAAAAYTMLVPRAIWSRNTPVATTGSLRLTR